MKIKFTNVMSDEKIVKLMQGVECELHITEEDEYGIRAECYAICEVSTLQEFFEIINTIGIEVIITDNPTEDADVTIEIYDNYRE